jgi:hypothetical protein
MIHPREDGAASGIVGEVTFGKESIKIQGAYGPVANEDAANTVKDKNGLCPR